jgi:hypothetical protein
MNRRPFDVGKFVTALAIAAFALLLLALGGCAATPQPVQLPETVLVPVPASCPVPNIPQRPRLPLADLPTDAQPDAVARAYAETVETLQGYARQLEALLEAYNPEKSNAAD